MFNWVSVHWVSVLIFMILFSSNILSQMLFKRKKFFEALFSIEIAILMVIYFGGPIIFKLIFD